MERAGGPFTPAFPTCPSSLCLPPFQNGNLEPGAFQECCPREAKPTYRPPLVPRQMRHSLPSPPKKMAVGLRATLPCSGMLFQSQTREYGLISKVQQELAAWKERLGRVAFLRGGHKPLARLQEAVRM